MASSVAIEKLAEKMKLTNVIPEISMEGKKIVTSEIIVRHFSLRDILIIFIQNECRSSDT